jgi:hypothetical protein
VLVVIWVCNTVIQMNAATTTATSLPSPASTARTTPTCTICSNPFHTDHTCLLCDLPYCDDHGCSCDHITAQHALAVAYQALWLTPLTSLQTLLVQDDWGTFYAHAGPTDWMLEVPPYEGEPDHAAYLPLDLHKVHRVQQEMAVKNGSLHYRAGQYDVAVTWFSIEGRPFTASVFSHIN